MRDRTEHEAAREHGFSFLEIMIVVLIIGMLTTVLATNIFGRFGQAQHQLARTQMEKIAGALELYKVDNGTYPSADQGLDALVTQPTGDPQPRNWLPGGYLRRDDLMDPWQRPFEYRQPGQHNSHSFDLYSYGADGAEGGEDTNADISNWDSGA